MWQEDQKSRRVLVANLPENLDSRLFEAFFSLLGKVRNAYVICDFKTKMSKTYGYVEFFEADVASSLISRQIIIGSNYVSCFLCNNKQEEQSILSSLRNGDDSNIHLLKTQQVQAKDHHISGHPTGQSPNKVIDRLDGNCPAGLTSKQNSKPKQMESSLNAAVKHSESWQTDLNSRRNNSPSNYRFNLLKGPNDISSGRSNLLTKLPTSRLSGGIIQ